MIKLQKEKLNLLYDKISSKYPLYLPLKKAGEVNYGLYSSEETVSLETLKTVKSAKDFFFPQSENMMGFKTDGKNIEVIDVRSEKDPFVLFGVRACDYKSFDILDKVFLMDPVDTFYQARREAGIIVTHACGRPEESCFCKVFDIDASNPMGDITLWTDDNYAYFRKNTEKANDLFKLIEEIAENGGENEVENIKEGIKAIIDKLPYSNLDLSTFKPENLNELFASPEWEKLSEACLGCGTCTFVCPTCQCFDIRDFKTNNGVIRFRCWDSCMYSDFTLMAHGNSRNSQMQRFRQRFMHKLVYYPSQNGGVYSCVGCGRCVNKCPQRLNIVKVIKKLGEKKNG